MKSSLIDIILLCNNTNLFVVSFIIFSCPHVYPNVLWTSFTYVLCLKCSPSCLLKFNGCSDSNMDSAIYYLCRVSYFSHLFFLLSSYSLHVRSFLPSNFVLSSSYFIKGNFKMAGEDKQEYPSNIPQPDSCCQMLTASCFLILLSDKLCTFEMGSNDTIHISLLPCDRHDKIYAHVIVFLGRYILLCFIFFIKGLRLLSTKIFCLVEYQCQISSA